MRRRDLMKLTAAALAAGAAGCAAATVPQAAASPRRGARLRRFTSSQGLTSRYRFDKASGSGSKGIVIYLHGDGHGEFDSGATVLDDHAAVARERGLSFVAPITPDRATGTWWRAESSGQWLRELLEHLWRNQAVDTSRVWFVGYSGGAEVITNVLLPDHSDLFTGGGALLVGGGSLDPQVVFTRSLSQQLRSGFVMHWAIGELDTPSRGGADGDFDALGEAQAAERAYRERGMTRTTLEVLPGETHESSIRHAAPTLRRLLG
ncbi:hypothetical protein [Arachnia propionica]|uniref:Uncharacterized protein n=1 Tax=Arachnia propionica TaxID=1750 RepID=A0A3P1WNL5_9ACTN|nr:hypothetical protein [Arachnia propionica]RRD48164.1 hypothetical protein EII35_14125 [Arachnia propionica]